MHVCNFPRLKTDNTASYVKSNKGVIGFTEVWQVHLIHVIMVRYSLICVLREYMCQQEVIVIYQIMYMGTIHMLI